MTPLATADALFGKIIRRDGYCHICGSTEVVQCAHGFSRRYRAVRWDERNAWALCRRHHLYFTHRPLEWEEWMRDEMGDDAYDKLRYDALYGDVWTPKDVIPVLRERARALGLVVK